MDKEWAICKDEKKIADSRPLIEGCIMKLTTVWGGSMTYTRVSGGEEATGVDKFLFNVCVDFMIVSVLVNLEHGGESSARVKVLAKLLFENYEFIHKLAVEVCDDLALGLLPAKGEGGN